MSTDNRYKRNNCDANTGWAGNDTANPIATAGSFIEGSGALSTQLSDSDEHMYTTQDSTAAGTFNVDFSDRTIYMNIKDNLGNSYANNGIQVVIGDGTDRIGYSVAGNDAVGMPQQLFFSAFKLDCSESAATAGNHAVYAGTEANLTYTAITQIGYGSRHLAKAVGSVDNVIMDGFYDIANGSYALTINGGTSGTPETMADVVGDDETNGWGLVSNPLGSQYIFFGPTEWGEDAAAADHYFTATDEQWYWLGDNAGGRAVGATHFPFRVIGNATDTGSFVITNVVIVNTGTAAEFDCSSTNVNTLEISGCSMSGLASFEAPASGGTSRFCKNTQFSTCGQVTSNLCDMSGNSYLNSTVAADNGALVYNETLTGAKSLTTIDNSTFEQGTNAHHAITFGTGITQNITLTGHAFNGFSSVADSDGATLQFLATSGSINCSLIDCTVDGNPATTANVGIDDAAGITVALIINPVITKFTVRDNAGGNLQNARVLAETADNGGGSGFPYQAAVTSITQTAGLATLTAASAHGLASNDYVTIRGAQPDGYNKAVQITVTGTTTFTYAVNSGLSSPATGTPVFSYAPIVGLTDINGEIQSSKTWPASQGLKGWARKKNISSPFYQDGNITVADASGGTNQIIILQPDE